MEKLFVLLMLVSLALPANAAKNHTIVELHDRYKVLQVGEIHLRDDNHLLQIMCFLNKGRRLVYQDLATHEFDVMSSRRFAKEHTFTRLEQQGDITVWTGSGKEKGER